MTEKVKVSRRRQEGLSQGVAVAGAAGPQAGASGGGVAAAVVVPSSTPVAVPQPTRSGTSAAALLSGLPQVCVGRLEWAPAGRRRLPVAVDVVLACGVYWRPSGSDRSASAGGSSGPTDVAGGGAGLLQTRDDADHYFPLLRGLSEAFILQGASSSSSQPSRVAFQVTSPDGDGAGGAENVIFFVKPLRTHSSGWTSYSRGCFRGGTWRRERRPALQPSLGVAMFLRSTRMRC